MMVIDDPIFRDVFDGPHSNGHTEHLINLINWEDAYNRPPIDSIVDGFLFPGRWTALIAPAKTGKSTLLLHAGHRLARGYDPFTPNRQTPTRVLYLDGEMGETDTIERLQALELKPGELDNLHYTDQFPKGDTIAGGAAIVSTAINLDIDTVILDGLNAFITGAEKDDTPWRNLFEHTIAPLKRAGKAILSGDNTGKDLTLGARGSSVKHDKADGIGTLKRTDNGLNLEFKQTRTHGYTRSLDLAMRGLEGEQPINIYTVQGSWPEGTAAAAALLDQLAIPHEWGRGRASQALRDADKGMRNDLISAAIKYRKTVRDRSFTDLGDSSPGQVPF